MGSGVRERWEEQAEGRERELEWYVKKKKDCFKIKKCRRYESYKAYIKSLTNLKNNKNIVKCFLRLGFWSYESLSLTLLGLFTICL